MKEKLLIVLIFVFFGITTGIAQSGNVEEIATITGNPTVFGIGLKDQYLYVNPGVSLIRIYDLSNPSNPILVGEVTYSSGFATNLDVFGNYLYIYGGPENNFLIFDITDPVSPNEIGFLELPPSAYSGYDAAHLANYSYKTANDTIYVINTLDKSAPFIENKIPCSEAGNSGLKEIYATTEFLYICVEDGVLIYDNSTLSMPEYHSIYPNGHYSLAVDTSNHRLITSVSWPSSYTHYVSDINDPFVPNLIFQGAGGSFPGRVIYSNGVLVQTGSDTGSQGVAFYKIEEDSSIFIEEFLGSISYSIEDMDAMGSVFILGKNGGIEILQYNDNTTNNPVIHVTPNIVSFENTFVGESTTEIIMVSNVGQTLLEVTDIISSPEVYTTDLTSFTIEPGNTQELHVTFSPDDVGLFEGLIQIENNDPENSVFEVPLSGIGDLDTYTGNEISNHHVQIFPNPINNILFVQNVEGDEITLFDLYGNIKLHLIAKSDMQEVDVSVLTTGIYLVRIINNEGATTKKIEVIR